MLVGTAATAEASGDSSIRPFHYRATNEELADLKRRVAATRWPERETVNDTTQGVQLATMQKLADYWANHHDWRRAEAQLFSYPNFITNIDGLDIHFIHVKSKHPNALPVIITHGWPGSIIEQLKIIGPLTDPTAYGGTAADAFDVVIPSLPGYGFSGKTTDTGMGRAAHRQGVGRADEAARLHALRRAGRRLGQCDQRSDGASAAAGPARDPHQHVGDAAGSDPQGAPGGAAAGRAFAGRAACLGSAYRLLHAWPRLCARDEPAAADALRDRGFAGRPRRMDARPRHPELRPDRARVRRRAGRA